MLIIISILTLIGSSLLSFPVVGPKQIRSECKPARAKMLGSRCILRGNIIGINGIDIANPLQEEREIAERHQLSLGHCNEERLTMEQDDIYLKPVKPPNGY